MSGWLVFLTRLVRRIWFRAAIFSVVAIAIALLTGFVGPLLPGLGTIDIGQDSVGSILEILASSMLAVTTFSLTAMVTAYSTATTIGTPRATQLLVQDHTSQNALSTFLGSFLFAIVGLVALSTGYYGSEGRTVLFLATLIVIGIVAVTLLRWISHLTRFGRMADVIDRVERAATSSIIEFARRPHLGARPPLATEVAGTKVAATSSGFLTNIDVGALERWAAERDAAVHVSTSVGSVIRAGQPLAVVTGAADDDLDPVAGAFQVDHHRTFDQDPRLGVIALAEIGSRALSPGTNDPGTAIDVLAAIQRVFDAAFETEASREVEHAHVHLPAPNVGDLVEDAFRPLARDGAGMVEVQIRLQKTLGALAASAPSAGAAVALRAASAEAWTRSRRALTHRADRRQVRAAMSDGR